MVDRFECGNRSIRRSVVFRAKLFDEVREVIMKDPVIGMRDIANKVGHSETAIANAYRKIRASSEFQDWIKEMQVQVTCP